METVTRNTGRKSNARKRAASTEAKAKPVKTAPVVDVPNSQEKQIAEFVKSNKQKVADYMTKNFDEVSDDDVQTIAREVAECVILKRSPKAGGVWGNEVDIIEGVITAVQGPKVAAVDLAEPLVDSEPDAEAEPEVDEEESEDGEPEESEADEPEAAAEDAATEDETQNALASEPSSAAKAPSTKTKDKKMTTAAKKKAAPTKAKAEPTKKPTKAKASSKATTKGEKSERTPALSAAQIKSLKGKEQWFAAARLLKSEKKIWIQAQDIPDVIGHLYEVSIGKAKLKEEGFEGKGEKVYRRNRILGFKETIEDYLKSLK